MNDKYHVNSSAPSRWCSYTTS